MIDINNIASIMSEWPDEIIDFMGNHSETEWEKEAVELARKMKKEE